MACRGVKSHVEARQTASGVKDTYTQHWIDHLLARSRQLKQAFPQRSDDDIAAELKAWVLDCGEDIYNPLLRMHGKLFQFSTPAPSHGPILYLGLDPNRDTPVEILHTILLGIVKYAWYMTHMSLTDKQLDEFFTRLQSTSIDGLTTPPIRALYLQQYRNSLLGKQFKQIVQATVFHLDGLVDEPHFNLWKAVGSLCALLWFPEIKDIDQYLVRTPKPVVALLSLLTVIDQSDIRIAIENTLDLFAVIDPSKISTKIKMHLLDHIPEDIRNFGPIIGRSTEVFESFNAVFRYCAILSNRLSPSRDIAVQLADQENFKQRLTGGQWSQSGQWVRASPKILSYLAKHAFLQKNLGWTVANTPRPGQHYFMRANFSPFAYDVAGTIRLVATRLRAPIEWQKTDAVRSINVPQHDSHSTWLQCEYLITDCGDRCKHNAWVAFKCPFTVSATITDAMTTYSDAIDSESSGRLS